MEIKHEEGRIAIYENNMVIGECDYSVSNSSLIITHTYTDPILRGQGMAAKMVDEVIKIAAEKNLTLSATCSYAANYLEKLKTRKE
ncbi:MAG: GNAT family N-acetyltransferase [Bacilli bacterium]